MCVCVAVWVRVGGQAQVVGMKDALAQTLACALLGASSHDLPCRLCTESNCQTHVHVVPISVRTDNGTEVYIRFNARSCDSALATTLSASSPLTFGHRASTSVRRLLRRDSPWGGNWQQLAVGSALGV